MPPSTRRQVLTAGAAGLAALAGCTGPDLSLPETPTGEWRHRAHDARNAGAAEVRVPDRVEPAWDAGDIHTAAPVLADGTVYTVDDSVTALDGKTGSVQWQADLSDDARHAPALTADGLVVATNDQRLRSFALSDGSEHWTVQLPGRPADALSAAGGEVVVPCDEGGTVAYATADGTEQWRNGFRAAEQPAVGDDSVYLTGFTAGGDGVALVALSQADGTERWRRPLDDLPSTPTFTPESVLVRDGDVLFALDPADGTEQWQTRVGGRILNAPPAVADGTVYTPGDGVVALSLADGTEQWRADGSVTVDTGVAVGRDAVVTVFTDVPGVVALDRTDGSVRWRHQIDGFDVAVTTPPAIADGAVFYTSNESLGLVALGDLGGE
ncbi:PQQ-binding-like beta-propeller repeat protein [Halorarius litoreus]|uniref:outer membrane protein assembly factor BamB family protein n=1 Tax=Halorarius litoreus TaxID=2962676 RepID=UPI0020CFE3B8|nr:PQQ-binding-like beta-propeller repeat protein [Halorarius litoreus]